MGFNSIVVFAFILSIICNGNAMTSFRQKLATVGVNWMPLWALANSMPRFTAMTMNSGGGGVELDYG